MMKIFITGGTGFIGSSVVTELVRAGHDVVGLARNADAANKLKTAGARSHRGDLTDTDALVEGAKAAEGVLHLGFIHDFERFKEVSLIDRNAILAMGEALLGTDKPLVVTASVAMIRPGALASESDRAMPSSDAYPRASEEAVDALVRKDVNASVVRLPPSVHGKGDRAFIPAIMQYAKEKGFSAYVDSGKNRWCAVHREDAAELFRLAIEHPTRGARYHGVAESEVEFIDIAKTIGEHLDMPIRSISFEEAERHFAWLAGFIAMDSPASSDKTRADLLWQPARLSLIDDINENYF